MITTPRDYYNLYHRIQSENAPSLAILLPTDEKIYNVDLNSRTVEAPEYLGIEQDHRAEVIYFKVNRFYDFFDLTQAVCIIQYINALGESRAYPVPYYDIDTLSGKENSNGETDDLILFPWMIDQEVTKAKGIVEFNITFYRLTDTGSRYLYNLSTLGAKSLVLQGLNNKQPANLISIGYISEETFNSYLLNHIPLYIKENGEYFNIETYRENEVYYIDQEFSYFVSMKEDIYQRIHDIQGFDLYWEES